jgi:MraZ protein
MGSQTPGVGQVFQGASAISLDAKGRLAVPTRYRESILAQGAGKVVVTAHPHRCLLLYPYPAWEPIAMKIMALPSLDPHVSAMQQLLVGHADELEMDSAGRILIAPTLRRLSGIDRDVMMFGQGTHFKLWHPESWEKQFDAFSQLGPGVLPSGMDSLSL